MAFSCKHRFSLHVAIDFGTDGVGLAYAVENNVYIHQQWNSTRYGSIVKPKTIILLDENGNTKAFGLDAKTTYMSITSSKKNKWMLFDRFKMSLFNSNQMKRNNKEKINIIDELTATNGKKYPSEKVFIAAFQYLHNEAKTWLHKKIRFKDEEIEWIITVPAIWNDVAKHKMKQWAIKAGLVDANIENQCKIVYEPDCGSLAVQHYLKQYGENHTIEDENDCKVTSQFVTGDRYMLVDAGGGTVDIANHEYINDFQVKEVLKPSGGNWGSTYIDDRYIKLLQDMFSTEWIDEFNKAQPNDYVKIIHNFQQSKATFYQHPHKQSHNVELSLDFCCFLEEKLEELEGSKWDDIEDMVSDIEICGMTGLVELNDDVLEIDKMLWESMFDHVIDPTIAHIKGLLNYSKMKINCKYLCLVGGLSCSPYFQYRIKQTFEYKSEYNLKIIIPDRPILCVIEGAARLGIEQNYIKSRILSKTYGIKKRISEERAKELNIAESFIKNEKNRKYCGYKQRVFILNYFDILASKHQQIDANYVVSKRYRRQISKDNVSVIVVCSDDEAPQMATNNMVLGRFKYVFDEKDKSMDVNVEFHFYDTVFKVYAYSIKNPHKKRQLTIDYQHSFP